MRRRQMDLSIKSKAAGVAAPPSPPSKNRQNRNLQSHRRHHHRHSYHRQFHLFLILIHTIQLNRIAPIGAACGREPRAQRGGAALRDGEAALNVPPLLLAASQPTRIGRLRRRRSDAFAAHRSRPARARPKLSWRSNATNPKQACDDAVHYAMSRLAPGSSSKSQQQLLYPGLNSSSTPFAVRLYLFQHDAASSRCADPRLALQSAPRSSMPPTRRSPDTAPLWRPLLRPAQCVVARLPPAEPECAARALRPRLPAPLSSCADVVVFLFCGINLRVSQPLPARSATTKRVLLTLTRAPRILLYSPMSANHTAHA